MEHKMEDKISFETDGIISIQEVLSKEEYDLLQKKIDKFVVDRSDLNNRRYISFDELPFANDILDVLLNERLAVALKSIFDNPILFPDFILQVNNIPTKLPRPHYDLQSYSRYGTSHALQSSKYAKIGFYFQKNDENNPGSIWFIPRSHQNKFLLFINKHFNAGRLREKTLLIWKNYMKRYLVPFIHIENTYAIFDGRLLHSSAPRSNLQPDGFTKYSIYFSVIGSRDDARALLKNELEKFATEVYSSNPDESQRIGYMFANPFRLYRKKLENLGLSYVDLSSKYLMDQK